MWWWKSLRCENGRMVDRQLFCRTDHIFIFNAYLTYNLIFDKPLVFFWIRILFFWIIFWNFDVTNFEFWRGSFWFFRAHTYHKISRTFFQHTISSAQNIHKLSTAAAEKAANKTFNNQSPRWWWFLVKKYLLCKTIRDDSKVID